jgi:outer membrane protein OmpA-like peptidoglycan-associated protein
MKRALLFILILFVGFTLQAQVKNVQKETERQGTNRLNRKIDSGIDKGFDKIEDGIGSLFGKKKKKKGKSVENNTSSSNQSTSSNQGNSSSEGANSVAGQDPEALFAEHGVYPPENATGVPTSLTLKWTPMDGDGFKASGYEVYISEDSEASKPLGSCGKNEIKCSDLKPFTKYNWEYKGQASSGQYMPGGFYSFTTGDGKGVATQPNVQWSKFDFVPGDEVIFEDGPSVDEENGEFPSRWDLVDGQVEIAEVDGENVMMFLDGGEIVPYLKNSDKDYLPEVFTIEFDFYKPTGGHRLTFYLTDQKNQRGKQVYDNAQEFDVTPVRIDPPEGGAVLHSGRDANYCENGCWTHVSLAYTKGKLKVYLDDTRLVNIPHYSFHPTGFTMYPYFASAKENKAFYVKNVRIAKGGVKYYDRVLSDGKIIVNGIRFDVNKATIKPESNGAINEIFQLMQKQTDLNFSVEGHTDSDGDDALNQTLSEKRAKAVMDRLISMGISANRLKYAGWGESKPIGENGTPEGKANNRRVEFVKFTGNAAPSSSSSANGVSSSAANSAFDSLNRKSIAQKLEQLPDAINIPISNNNGTVNGEGTIILYATSDGNLGKMEILDVDKNDGYKLTARFVSYDYNGSVHSESNHLEIPGTYTCDLDKGTIEDIIQSEVDFHYGRQDKTTGTLYPGETAILRVLNK